MSKKYLQAPFGYGLNKSVEENDTEGLREFALSLFENAPMLEDRLKHETLKGLQEFFIDNGFTFGERLNDPHPH